MYDNRPQVITARETAIIMEALADAIEYRSRLNDIPYPDGTIHPEREKDQQLVEDYQRLMARLGTPPQGKRNWAGNSEEWLSIPERRVFILKDNEWNYIGDLKSVDFSDIPPPYKIVLGRDVAEVRNDPGDNA